METTGWNALQVNINGYKIYLDIMMGKNCRQYRLLTWTFFISQFVQPVGEEMIRERLAEEGKPASSFSLLGYIIIRCNIQVIINPFLYHLHNEI